MRRVHKKEHALKKKGVGYGIHQSDVICSTVGWFKLASQSLKYGKNYEGYWNGELFVKQVCYFWNHNATVTNYVATVEGENNTSLQRCSEARLPGPFPTNNSQGHLAYSKDAFLTS